MSHSFTKLDLFLKSNNFIPQSLYTIDNSCVYIELFNTDTSEIIFLYIQSKFNIKPEKYPTYSLKYIEIQDEEGILSKYTSQPNKQEMKNHYFEINIEDEDAPDDLEGSLKENYGQILLKDINSADKETIKDIFRQLTRFKLCTQNIEYKLSIIYKNYLCSIKYDDTIECYYINNFPTKKEKRLFVTVDLKTFYKNIGSIKENIKIVKSSIYGILNQNYSKHSKTLVDMFEQKEKVLLYIKSIYAKKLTYDQYIIELEKMLTKLNKNEEELLEQKTSCSRQGNSGIKGLQDDIQKSHDIHKLNTKLEEIYGLKRELTDDMLKTRAKQENIMLELDKILFENSVMLNEIIKNFNLLSSIYINVL